MPQLIFNIVVVALMLILIYRMVHQRNKLERLRRRYDLLLRGRGDLNMEELLRAHSRDIDVALKRLSVLEKNYRDLNDITRETMGGAENQLTQLENRMDKTIQTEVEGTKRLLLHQLDLLEKSTDQRFHLEQQDRNSDVASLQKVFLNGMEENKKELNLEITKLQNKTTREMTNISNRLALAIQRVGLYKYDAFDNIAGSQSYTLVLLDRYNNGYLITNLYSRQGSNSFAKPIRNGQSDVPLSPQEEEALRQVLGK